MQTIIAQKKRRLRQFIDSPVITASVDNDDLGVAALGAAGVSRFEQDDWEGIAAGAQLFAAVNFEGAKQRG